MAKKIDKPTFIKAAGSPAKLIAEYVGRVNSKMQEVSIARMVSPQGWNEPGQRPEFDEYSVVLRGTLKLKLRDREIEVHAGQAVWVERNEWAQYSTPHEGGAEYISVCLPAFSPQTAHRDMEEKGGV